MSKDQLGDQELYNLLVDRTQRHRAFALVVERYSARVYWQIRRMVYNHEDANDLVQNTFLKAWESLERFKGEAKISTWLYAIALNESLQYLRREQSKSKYIFMLEEEQLAQLLLTRLEADPYFDGDSYERTFQQALLSLPERQGLVFRMRYYDELSYEDMSQILNISVGALKASYHHAVKKLEQILAQSSID